MRAAAVSIVCFIQFLCSDDMLTYHTVKAGEICGEWQTWSKWLNVHSILGQSLLQSSVYMSLAVSLAMLGAGEYIIYRQQVAFASTAAVLVQTYAP
jgi:chloride channel 3/4/5